MTNSRDSNATRPDEGTRVEVVSNESSRAEPSPGSATATESALGPADYEQRLQEAENRALRIQADLENFRRRTRREMDDQLKYATLPLITDLLEVVDNLSRAVNVGDSPTDQGLLEGVRMVQNQLNQVLEKHGCRKIPALHLAFDPHVHSAVEMRPSDAPANTIIAEASGGYTLHDRVIRPSHVVLSTGETS